MPEHKCPEGSESQGKKPLISKFIGSSTFSKLENVQLIYERNLPRGYADIHSYFINKPLWSTHIFLVIGQVYFDTCIKYILRVPPPPLEVLPVSKISLLCKISLVQTR